MGFRLEHIISPGEHIAREILISLALYLNGNLMFRYLAHRLLQSGTILLLISVVVFAVMHLAPGSPISARTRQPRTSAENMKLLEAQYGLDDPVHIRYIRWLNAVLQGDLGNSFFTRRSVAQEIRERIGNTLYLIGSSFLAVILISILVGTLCAYRPNSKFDIFINMLTYLGQSLPEYWLSIILITVFYSYMEIPITGDPLFPIGGMYSLGTDGKNIFDRVWHLILPITAIGFPWASRYVRIVRANVLEIINQSYITTARAKGLKEITIFRNHVLKNIAPVLLTLVALDAPYLFAGALYIEIIFSWPGMGRLFYDSAIKRDYPVLMGIVMCTSLLVILCNLFADVVHSYVDPRVRLG